MVDLQINDLLETCEKYGVHGQGPQQLRRLFEYHYIRHGY